jgi:hypothetical protein
MSNEIIQYLKELKFLSTPQQPKSELPHAWDIAERLGLRMHRDRGSYRSYFCPFHKSGMEREGSFMIRQDGAIMDFHNDKGYNVINLIMEYKKCTYAEAIRWIENTFNIRLNNKDSTKSAKKQHQIQDDDGSNALKQLNNVLPSGVVKLQKFTTDPASYRLIFQNGLYIDFDTVNELLKTSYIRAALTELFNMIVQIDTKTWHSILSYLFVNAFEVIQVHQQPLRETLIDFIIDTFRNAKYGEIDKVMNAVVYDEVDKRFYFKLKVLERALQTYGLNVKLQKLFKVLKEEFNLGRTRKKTSSAGIQYVYFVDEVNFKKHLPEEKLLNGG